MTNLIKHHNISEANAIRAAKDKYINITGPFSENMVLPYSESTYVQGKGFITYAEYECFNFKRIKTGYKKYTTMYEVKKIKYDNSYDFGYTPMSKDNYIARTNRTWYEND